MCQLRLKEDFLRKARTSAMPSERPIRVTRPITKVFVGNMRTPCACLKSEMRSTKCRKCKQIRERTETLGHLATALHFAPFLPAASHPSEVSLSPDGRGNLKAGSGASTIKKLGSPFEEPS